MESNSQDCCLARRRGIIPLILNLLKDERPATESNFQDCCATRSRRTIPLILNLLKDGRPRSGKQFSRLLRYPVAAFGAADSGHPQIVGLQGCHIVNIPGGQSLLAQGGQGIKSGGRGMAGDYCPMAQIMP